jgi:hypothetical protein
MLAQTRLALATEAFVSIAPATRRPSDRNSGEYY